MGDVPKEGKNSRSCCSVISGSVRSPKKGIAFLIFPFVASTYSSSLEGKWKFSDKDILKKRNVFLSCIKHLFFLSTKNKHIYI